MCIHLGPIDSSRLMPNAMSQGTNVPETPLSMNQLLRGARASERLAIGEATL